MYLLRVKLIISGTLSCQNMGHAVRKFDFDLCEQTLRKPYCAAAPAVWPVPMSFLFCESIKAYLATFLLPRFLLVFVAE